MGLENPNENDLFSLDTGLNENPFQGNYFDMNTDHRTGNLKNMRPQDQLDLEGAKKLTLLPTATDSQDHDEL